MHHAPGIPTGNAATTAPVLGYPPKAPPVTAPEIGTDLWNAQIQCHEVRTHDPPPKAPPGAAGTVFGSVFSAAVMSFEYVEEPDDGVRMAKGCGPTVVIRPANGKDGSAQSSQHGNSLAPSTDTT